MKRKYDAEWLRGIAELSGWDGVWVFGDDPPVAVPSKEDAAKAMDINFHMDPFQAGAKMFANIATSKTPGMTVKLALLATMVFLGEEFSLVKIEPKDVEHWLKLLKWDKAKGEEAIFEHLQIAPFSPHFDTEILRMAGSEIRSDDVPERMNGVLDRLWAYSIAHHYRETLFEKIKEIA